MAFEIETLDRNMIRMSVVIPVYSETDSLRKLVFDLGRLFGDRIMEFIVVVADRSSADSKAVCSELAAQDSRIRVLPQNNNPGVGNAYKEGLAAALGDPILTIDSDGEMEVATAPLLLDKMLEGNHGLVIGSRWMRGGGFSGYGKLKYILNLGFQKVFRVMFCTRLHDLTYGYKLLRLRVVKDVDWTSTRHEIGCETTLKPIRLGVSAAEVPTRWTSRVQGASKNNFSSNFRYVRMALSILLQPAKRRGTGVHFIAAKAHEPRSVRAKSTI
jgi:dolichol-phosphate mannosyltransferase